MHEFTGVQYAAADETHAGLIQGGALGSIRELRLVSRKRRRSREHDEQPIISKITK